MAKPQAWRGGVSPDVALKERGGHPSARPVAATIVRRRDLKARLKLSRAADFVVDETVIVDGGWEIVGAVVLEVHLDGRLVDVRLRAELEETRVSVTKFRWGAG